MRNYVENLSLRGPGASRDARICKSGAIYRQSRASSDLEMLVTETLESREFSIH